ncbi:hypothetical protein BT67DRAFT_448492 [Trichocladium antarcticum]|uniref:VOC domain-containing protein n=1 Tax=Trichocladium antarcticum TaxID=1450529 RepID=A0AAN6UNF2_9PEZI|nr:hypothetical protein BT67DRAFT_448492 [Trichocladium antarcticum]
MLPFLEVEHLPSSSSFYSAVVQPLGLYYLFTEDSHFPSASYGTSAQAPPVFRIQQVVPSRDRPLRRSRIVFSAPSAASADHAYEFALRANPDARASTHPRHRSESYTSASGASAQRTSTSGGGTRVLITDFDGNMIEIVYRPPPAHYPPDYTGESWRMTNSTTEEAKAIVGWQFDIGRLSLSDPSGASSVSSGSARAASRRSRPQLPEDDDQAHPKLRRSVTAGSSVYEPATSARENSNGLSAGAVVGALLGVAAAGAAAFTTYNMVRSDRSRPHPDDYDTPSLSRRSTVPGNYDGYPPDHKSRYVEAEPAVDRRHYPHEYPPSSGYRRPPPEFIARYSEVGSTPSSRDVDDRYDDPRGRHPPSRSRSRPPSRAPSQSASHREAYDEPERRSYVSSKSSRHPPVVQRHYTYDPPDRDQDSYVSSKSHRSTSTLRAAPAPDLYTTTTAAPPPHMSSRSRSSSRVTAATVKASSNPRTYSREGSHLSARHVPLPDSRAPTYVAAYDVPLPHSRAPTYYSSRDVPLPESRDHTYVSSRPAPYPDTRAHTNYSARDVPLPPSRAHTYLSARDVPLPASRVGGRRRAKWEDEEAGGGGGGGGGGDDDDDDADSIAPDDSISCVGGRGSRR